MGPLGFPGNTKTQNRNNTEIKIHPSSDISKALNFCLN
jgi:hypothetical protein